MDAYEFKCLLCVLQNLHEHGCRHDVTLGFAAFDVKAEGRVLLWDVHDQIVIIYRSRAGSGNVSRLPVRGMTGKVKAAIDRVGRTRRLRAPHASALESHARLAYCAGAIASLKYQQSRRPPCTLV
jgi:hypothetical protein